MKRKKNITKKQIETYLREYGIDKDQLIAERNTIGGRNELNQIFERFAGAYIDDQEGLVIIVENDSGEQHKTALGKDPDFDLRKITSLNDFVQMMNVSIDLSNAAMERVHIARDMINDLSQNDQETFVRMVSEGNQMIGELRNISEKRPLEAADFTTDRVEVIKWRNQALESLHHGSQERFEISKMVKNQFEEQDRMVIGYSENDKNGKLGRMKELNIDLESIETKEIVPIKISDVKDFIQKHSTIDPDKLYDPESFVRQTKEGKDILNKALNYFTEYNMEPNRGLVYTNPEEESEQVIYQRIQSFDDLKDLDELVEHMNKLNMHKERNKMIMKAISENERKNDEMER